MHSSVRVVLSEGGNIFGITVGVGITVLVKNQEEKSEKSQLSKIYYQKVYGLTSNAKFNFLRDRNSLKRVEWQELHPDQKYSWLTKGMLPISPGQSFGTGMGG
jgi:predicted helicase